MIVPHVPIGLVYNQVTPITNREIQNRVKKIVNVYEAIRMFRYQSRTPKLLTFAQHRIHFFLFSNYFRQCLPLTVYGTPKVRETIQLILFNK